jgi:hypothetical protein
MTAQSLSRVPLVQQCGACGFVKINEFWVPKPAELTRAVNLGRVELQARTCLNCQPTQTAQPAVAEMAVRQ